MQGEVCITGICIRPWHKAHLAVQFLDHFSNIDFSDELLNIFGSSSDEFSLEGSKKLERTYSSQKTGFASNRFRSVGYYLHRHPFWTLTSFALPIQATGRPSVRDFSWSSIFFFNIFVRLHVYVHWNPLHSTGLRFLERLTAYRSKNGSSRS